MNSSRIGVLLLGAALTGCTPLRVFQSKVPPPALKPDTQVEAERAAADLIARKIETPVELKPVAAGLSSSLGAPKHSLVDVRAFDLPTAAQKADTGLQDGMVRMQQELLKINSRLAQLQGKPVEGTGISILGPSTVILLGALIALGVVFPPAFTLLFAAFRRLRSTTSTIVRGIDQVAKDPSTQQTIAKLKSNFAGEMDKVHKQIVHSLQRP